MGQAALYADGHAVGSYMELRNQSLVPQWWANDEAMGQKTQTPLHKESQGLFIPVRTVHQEELQALGAQQYFIILAHIGHTASSPPFIRVSSPE